MVRFPAKHTPVKAGPIAMELYERVDEAVRRGEIWRAKEILRGSIRSRGYDTELYERYGRLLLDLQETLEAGKYLLLSGMRRPEYEASIELCLSRIGAEAIASLRFSRVSSTVRPCVTTGISMHSATK